MGRRGRVGRADAAAHGGSRAAGTRRARRPAHRRGRRLVVDVRRFPGSRNNPDVAREALEEWLPALGIGYRWDERLGGRRRLPPGEPVADGWWTVAPVRRLRRPHPDAGVHRRARRGAGRGGGTATVAVMCSESVWWRCHRRLIADVAVLGRGVPVTHLMPDGRLTPHRPSEGAVVGADGVRWPAL